MELYLIRHGETVDNVAGVYAGVRDSALTIHGVEQARRLGEHFATQAVAFDRIFASPLSRALKTAKAIQTAQPVSTAKSDETASARSLEITQVKELIEQDFGFAEGMSFQARTDAKKTGREAYRDRHKDDPGFVDVESKDSIDIRADVFLDQHLLPLFKLTNESRPRAVAVVAHGILLSHLWRRLLLRLPSKSVTVAPEVTAIRGTLVLQHLGGWSNTGYLQLAMTQDQPGTGPVGVEAFQTKVPVIADTTEVVTDEAAPEEQEIAAPEPEDTAPEQSSRRISGWSTTIVAVDRKDHLVGLKRQRGGIGRIAHDESQKKLTGFFKKQRTT
jgi:broad specificity phosphatase PhoE